MKVPLHCCIALQGRSERGPRRNGALYFLAVLVLAPSLSRCNFRKDAQASADSGPVAPSNLELAVDWSNEPNPILGVNLKAVRQFDAVEVEPATLSASNAVSLPVSVPSSLYLGAEIPEFAFKEEAEFARGELTIQGQRFQVVNQVIQAERIAPDRRRVAIIIAGLNALMIKEASSIGRLTVNVFSKTKKLVTFSATLRTPPSHIGVEVLSVKDWRETFDQAHQAMLSPDVSGTRINLVRALRLKNQEETVSEVEFSRRPGAVMSQYTDYLTYRDTGCGYAVDQSATAVPLSSSVILAPIDETFIPQAAAAMDEQALNDRISFLLAPGEEKVIGVFAVGPQSNAWLDSGPQGTAEYMRTVPSDCYNVCTEWESTGPGCHGPDCSPGSAWFPAGNAPNVKEPFANVCVHYERRRHDAQITVGTIRAPVLLQVPEGSPAWTSRFADVDFRKDGEVRAIPVQPTNDAVPWFQ